MKDPIKGVAYYYLTIEIKTGVGDVINEVKAGLGGIQNM